MAEIFVRCPDELKDKIRCGAQRLGIPINAYVIWILREWMEKSEGAGCKSH